MRRVYSSGCVWKNVPVHILYIGELYTHYKQGLFLEDGGLNDQPVWYLEMMYMMAGEMGRNDAEYIDKLNQRGKEVKRK